MVVLPGEFSGALPSPTHYPTPCPGGGEGGGGERGRWAAARAAAMAVVGKVAVMAVMAVVTAEGAVVVVVGSEIVFFIRQNQLQTATGL